MKESDKFFKLYGYIIVASLGLFPLVPFQFKPLSLYLAIPGFIYYLVKGSRGKASLTLFVMSALFMLAFISLSYTTFIDYGFKRLGTLIPLLVIPLAFFSRTKSTRAFNFVTVEKVFSYVFVLSAVLYCVLLVFYLYDLGYISGNVNYRFSISYISRRFWGINENPIYISIFLSIAILIVVFHFKGSLKKKVYLLFALIVLLSTLLFLEKRGPIIALFAALLVAGIFKMKRLKHQKRRAIIPALILGILVSLSLSSGRFSKLWDVKTFTTEIDGTSSIGIRKGIYFCAFQNIPRAGLFGFGIGDVVQELCPCYQEISLVLANGMYNTHNEYLHSWLAYGIIGILLLVLFWILHIRLALKSRDVQYLSIVIFFLLMFFFENLLHRQNGVYLFAVLLSYFAFRASLKDRVEGT